MFSGIQEILVLVIIILGIFFLPRILNRGEEKQTVISILKQIDNLSGGLELLDETLNPKNEPKQLKGVNEHNLPLMGELIALIRDDDKEPSIYDLELILRSSGKLRFIFNYVTALFYKIEKDPNN